ncbi:MAG TPA: phosphatase PAP2 family protein [Phycisphaerae bacterium]|nr:phosphatase PAP2 family protein [Phycisphaerae bacterium]
MAGGLAPLVWIVCGCGSARLNDDPSTLRQAITRAEQRRTSERLHHSAHADVADHQHVFDYPRLASDMGDDAAAASRPGRADGQPRPRGDLWATLSHDLKAMPKNLWADAKPTFTDKTNLMILGVAGGASLALRPEVDDDIEDKFHRSRALRPVWGDVFGTLGNPATHFALAGAWYLVGTLQQDSKTYEVGKTLFSALTINSAVTAALKAAACADAPNGESWAWPSGHTSSSVCFAAVMHEAYGPWVGVPLYGVAGMVALERLDDREHQFSDVVFGAALGWVVGHTVATGHRPRIFGGEVLPYADPGTGAAGLVWVKTLK